MACCRVALLCLSDCSKIGGTIRHITYFLGCPVSHVSPGRYGEEISFAAILDVINVSNWRDEGQIKLFKHVPFLYIKRTC